MYTFWWNWIFKLFCIDLILAFINIYLYYLVQWRVIQHGKVLKRIYHQIYIFTVNGNMWWWCRLCVLSIRDLFSASPMLVIGTTGALLQINAKTMEVFQYCDLQGAEYFVIHKYLSNYLYSYIHISYTFGLYKTSTTTTTTTTTKIDMVSLP